MKYPFYRIQTKAISKAWALEIARSFTRIPPEQTFLITVPKTDKWRVIRRLNEKIIERDIMPDELDKYMASLRADTRQVIAWRKKVKRSGIINMTQYLRKVKHD